MNADELLRHYERIADAPEAVARLRRFVLDLAVRGKLVPQDPRDEPAPELLKRLAKEKARLIRHCELRKENPLPPISKEAPPFHLPHGWAWSRLGHLSKLITIGSRDWASHYSEEGAIFVRMGNLSRGNYRLRLANIQRVKPPTGTEGARTRLEAGDVVISITGDVGLLGLIPSDFGEAYINQHTCVVRPMVDLQGRFLPELFRSPFAQDQFNAPQRGIKNSFRLTDVAEFLVPLPPLAEQHRIVAKVDELMALCDRLEAARAQREAARDRLARSCLARLDTPDPETFSEDARFALDALPALTARPDQIKPLRQTILDLAVRGKLVPQDPKDEPASELLQRIAAEKARLIKAGVVRSPRTPAPAIEAPFPIAGGWQWTQLSEVGLVSPRNEARDSEAASFVPMTLIPAEYGAKHGHEVRPWGEIKKGYTHFADGDVALAKITPCFENGKSTVFRQLTGGIGSGTTELHIVRPLLVVPDYVVLFLKCPHYIESGIPRMTGTAGQKRLPSEYFANSPFPLPPLAEQHRIVAKVDELMALCDQLEASLTRADEHRRRLLEALLHKALEPARLQEQAA